LLLRTNLSIIFFSQPEILQQRLMAIIPALEYEILERLFKKKKFVNHYKSLLNVNEPKMI